jgi:hypothetical protein
MSFAGMPSAFFSQEASDNACNLDHLIKECDAIKSRNEGAEFKTAFKNLQTSTKDLCTIIEELTTSQDKVPLTFEKASRKLSCTKEYEKGICNRKDITIDSDSHGIKSYRRVRIWKADPVRFKRITDKIVG